MNFFHIFVVKKCLMSINQEFKDDVSKLKFQLKTTQKGVAERLGVTPQYLSDVINGRQPYNDELKRKVYELCSNELGLVGDKSSPCFDIATIQGGAGHGTGMEQITADMLDQAAGRMLAPGLPTGEHIPYIQVRGDSMVNHKDPSKSIPDGAWVGVKASTLNAIQWGEVYAIMTTDGPIIKRIMQSDKEDCIRCVSFNEEDGFAPFDLPYTDIIQPLYNVLAVVNIKLWK